MTEKTYLQQYLLWSERIETLVTSRIFISKLIFFDNLLLAYLTPLDVAELKVDDDAEYGGEDAAGAEDADVGPGAEGGAESGPGLFFLSQSANLAEHFIKQDLKLCN